MTHFPLSLAVTGHRTLSTEQLPRIAQQVGQVLDAVRAEAEAIARAHARIFEPDPQLRVISCLAEGADRLVAHEGMRRGYKLGDVLPFPRHSEVHAHDFAPDAQAVSRSELHSLLDAAESVLELAQTPAGATGDSCADTPLARAQRQQAYTEVGIRMLEHSDLLIAIWNGEPQSMPSSTASMIEHAIQLGLLVIWIHAREAVPPLLYENNSDDNNDNTEPQRLDTQNLVSLRTALQKFAPPMDGTALCCPLQQCLNDCEREVLPKPFWYSWWERFFRRLAPSKNEKAAPAVPVVRKGLLSSLARYYGNLHRSFFLIACLLGTLTVCVAVAALALPAFNWHNITESIVKVVLGLVELSLLILLWWLHAESKKGEWQRKLTDYRLIAEHLRNAEFLRGLGLAVNALPSLPYYADNPADWVHWYIRVRVRQHAPLPLVSFADNEYVQAQKRSLLTDWLENQRNYHADNARRTKQAEECLHHLSESLFWITGICVVIHLALKIVHPEGISANVINLFGVLTILLPLWAMAAHAFGQYAEFRRLHARSAAMSSQLERLCTRMSSQNTPGGMTQIALEASSLVLHEVVEWKVQYAMPQIAKA